MIVVTGGAGFIGSNVVARLAGAEGKEVVVCDRLRSGEKWQNLVHHDLLDIIEPEVFTDWLDVEAPAVEAVIHMGAISSTTERDVDLIVEQNIRFTLDLWDLCAGWQIPFIYASSAATYGDGSQGFEDDPSPEALSRLRPLNAYGWSKHVVDRSIVRRAASGMAPPQWVGLKFFNVYGPNEYHKGPMRSVVHQAWEAAAGGRPVTLFRSHHPDFPDGGQMRDFVWVDDCVELIVWLIEHRRVSGIFNCGSGQARTFLDLAHAVHDALGVDPRIEWVDTPGSIRDRYQYRTEAAMGRIRAAGWSRAPTSLEEGVRRYIQEFLTAPDPWR